MTAFFDTHAHYDDKAFDEDRETLLEALPGTGIARVVNVGASLASCKRTGSLADRYDYIYAAVGIHPSETAELEGESPDAPGGQSAESPDALEQLKAMWNHEKCVAVGEIGLDYYWDKTHREVQKKWFARQLRFAGERGLPVIIHSRDAARDTIDIMAGEKAGEIGGVVHCFSYTKETAGIFLDMGFYIGIGGVLTFQNARKLKEAAAYIPMDRIVLETDCPYLAPAPYRGKRNSSLYLPLVAEVLAQVKGISEEEVRRAAWENGMRLYGMKEREKI